MNPLRVALIAALLSASTAYADAAPHWTAAIGTGHASESTSKNASAAPSTNTTSFATALHWNAFIGTGHAAESNPLPVAKSSAGGSPTATAHWTSRIGTGHASESSARAESSAVTAARARP
jgi:hypothetical protein